MFSIQGKIREVFGKQSKSVLGAGFVPVEMYGHGKENIHLQISTADLKKALKEVGRSGVINLELNGTVYPTLIHEIQEDVMGDNIIHVDLYQIKMDEKITTKIPVNFIGESAGVKEKGGILVKAISELEIEALPADLPQFIEADLSLIEDIHQSVHVKDLIIPKGVKVMAELDAVVATVVEQAKEEEAPPPVTEGVAGEEGAQPATASEQPTEESKKEEK